MSNPSYIQRIVLDDGKVLYQHHYVYDRLGNQLFAGQSITSIQNKYPFKGGQVLRFVMRDWGLIGYFDSRGFERNEDRGGCQVNQIPRTFWVRVGPLTPWQRLRRRAILLCNLVGRNIERYAQRYTVALYHELKDLGQRRVAEIVWQIGYRGIGGIGWKLSRGC